MNEEEKEKELTRTLIKAVDESKDVWFNMGFQKGKLEQKKEELEFLKRFRKYCYEKGFAGGCIWIDDRIKQLQKEIGEEKGK